MYFVSCLKFEQHSGGNFVCHVAVKILKTLIIIEDEAQYTGHYHSPGMTIRYFINN